MRRTPIADTVLFLGVFLAVAVVHFDVAGPGYSNFAAFSIVFVTLLVSMVLRRRGPLPKELHGKYTPLPLALVSPPDWRTRNRVLQFVLPTAEAAVKLVVKGDGGRADNIVKLVCEFFKKELGPEKKNLKPIRNAIRGSGLYNDIADEKERTPSMPWPASSTGYTGTATWPPQPPLQSRTLRRLASATGRTPDTSRTSTP